MRKTLLILLGIFVFLYVAGTFFAIDMARHANKALPDDANSQKVATTLFSSSTDSFVTSPTFPGKGSTTPYIVLGKTKLRINVVDTAAERARGLSGRTDLARDEGLLFVFGKPEAPDRAGIWMKDMNFPIDVIWFDKNLKVITIVSDMRPDSYPKVYSPSSPAQYVLEVNSGVVAREGIKVGDTASFL